MSQKSIFEYLDYREYLKEHYDASKQQFPFFSFRYIATKTGLDASFYVKVLQKQLHLSLKSLPIVIDFLGLKKKEGEYFALLVRFGRSRHSDEMKLYFEKIIKSREMLASPLDADKYEYFSTWYYVAVRELLNYYRFDGDYKTLGTKLNPPISDAKAKKAIDLLVRLGLVKKGENNHFELTDRFVTTGESWNSLAIENFQKQMLLMAEESIARLPKQDRETSTVTVSTSWKCFLAMKARLSEVRKELLEMARIDNDPDGVFQINFQIFPLTTSDKREVEQ
jgi:uncharacterized protein (TIGR02147 family)